MHRNPAATFMNASGTERRSGCLQCSDRYRSQHADPLSDGLRPRLYRFMRCEPTARLSGVSSGPPPVADPLFVKEVRPQCDRLRANKAWCASIDREAGNDQALDVARVIKVGPSQSLLAINKQAAPGPPAIKNWSAAEYGFCNVKGGGLVLCIATHTPSSAR